MLSLFCMPDIFSQAVRMIDAGKFVEEMDNLCKRCFGHTEWRIHTNSDEKSSKVCQSYWSLQELIRSTQRS